MTHPAAILFELLFSGAALAFAGWQWLSVKRDRDENVGPADPDG